MNFGTFSKSIFFIAGLSILHFTIHEDYSNHAFRNPASSPHRRMPGKTAKEHRERRKKRYQSLKINPHIWASEQEKPFIAERMTNSSPWLAQSESDANILYSYSAWNRSEAKREARLQIGKAALDMISRADEYLVASVFLFDNMYSEASDPDYDIVGEIFETIKNQKERKPNLKVALVLDPLHKAYSDRVSPVVRKLLDLGVDVFYSDLLPSKASNTVGKIIEPLKEVGRIVDLVSFGFLGSTWNYITSAPGPLVEKDLDGNNIDFLTIRNAILIKANHRKLLSIKGSDGWEALVSSANPHNASGPSANTGMTVKGDPAKFIYNTIRADIAHSLIEQEQRPLGWHEDAGFALVSESSSNLYGGFFKNFVNQYLTTHFPFQELEGRALSDDSRASKVRFTTENHIKMETLRILDGINRGDQVRLQMFYLSDPVIVDAIVRAGLRKKGDSSPIRIILDANKDAFNSIKDGSPNRQVANFLVNGSSAINEYYKSKAKNGKLDYLKTYTGCGSCFEIRWFATHGEQNHAKLISVSGKNKAQLFTGSSNWTRKNMGDVGVLGKSGPINMEANLTLENMPTHNSKYNKFFDKVWNNSEAGYLLSQDYDTWNLDNSYYHSAGWEKLKSEKVSMQDSIEMASAALKLANPYEAHHKYLIQIGRKNAPRISSEWKEHYMLKWAKGEASGLVGW